MSKKLLSIAMVLLLIMLPTGCKPKPMTPPDSFETLAAAVNKVTAGGTVTIPIAAPAESTDCAVTMTSDKASAVLSDGQLSITGLNAGTETASLLFSGKGYEPLTLNVPIEVVWPQLVVTADEPAFGLSGRLSDTAELSIDRDSIGEIALESTESDLIIQAASDNEAALRVKVDGTKLLLTSLAPGHATLTVTVKKDRFLDVSSSIAVTVQNVPVKLSLVEGASPITLQKGADTVIKLTSGGTLSVAVSNANAEATVGEDGKSIFITGKAVGESVVTVTAKQEGYPDGTLPISLTITEPDPPPAPKREAGTIAAGANADIINDIVKYTNIERANEGLAPLRLLATVLPAAQIRAEEAATLWSHTRPDGRICHTVLADLGLSFPNMGENLASADYTETGEHVVGRWMDSPGHRTAILTPEFTGLGVGVYYDGDMYYYCQTFVG